MTRCDAYWPMLDLGCGLVERHEGHAHVVAVRGPAQRLAQVVRWWRPVGGLPRLAGWGPTIDRGVA